MEVEVVVVEEEVKAKLTHTAHQRPGNLPGSNSASVTRHTSRCTLSSWT